jgi:hypothetical protein
MQTLRNGNINTISQVLPSQKRGITRRIWVTYKNLKAKTGPKLIFCPLVRLKAYIVFRGNTNIARFLAMINKALTYHIGGVGIQCLGILFSQSVRQGRDAVV